MAHEPGRYVKSFAFSGSSVIYMGDIVWQIEEEKRLALLEDERVERERREVYLCVSIAVYRESML